jgi:hypothetical protein
VNLPSRRGYCRYAVEREKVVVSIARSPELQAGERGRTSIKSRADVLARRVSLDGRGGALLEFIVVAPPCPFSLVSAGWFAKKDSSLTRSLSCPSSVRVALSEDGSPMRMRASRVESWLGFSRRSAFCVAARAVGEGGLGPGFIACATVSGMVGMLTEDTTGSVKAHEHDGVASNRRKMGTHSSSLCRWWLS